MALEPWTIGLVIIVNVLVGVGVIVSVYGLMERRIVLGAVGGLVLSTVVIYSETVVGEWLFDFTYGEIKLLVLVAGVGAAVGVTGTMLTLKPEL
jgi:hypothetical protein